jgi:hypothetical protein
LEKVATDFARGSEKETKNWRKNISGWLCINSDGEGGSGTTIS